MFSLDALAPNPRTRLAALLGDVLATATEFATLGEATFDLDAGPRLRYTVAQDRRPASPWYQPGPTGPSNAGAPLSELADRVASRSAWAPPDSLYAAAAAADADAAAAAAGHTAGSRLATHPHRAPLRARTRGRRPGAVLPRTPVCTLAPAPARGPEPAPLPERLDRSDGRA